MNIAYDSSLSLVWDEVLQSFGFPNINPPQLLSMPQETAHIDLQTLDIRVSKEFLNSLSLPLETSFKAVSAHELGHHITFPYDLTTCLEVISHMSKAGSKHPKRDENLFGDVIVNLDLVERGIVEIANVYRDFDNDGELFTAIKAIQSLKSNVDFGHSKEISENTYSLVMELNKLSYKHKTKKDMLSNAWKFSKIIQDHNVEYNGADLGELFEDNSKGVSKSTVINASNNLDAKQISELQNVKGLENIVDEILIQRYKALSKKYSILSAKKTRYMATSQDKEIKDFEVGNKISDVNVHKSFGKFMPGFSKVENSISYENEGEKEHVDLPNAILAIDTSGSMIDPKVEVSYAAIASFAIARTYTSHGSKVATYNFSSGVRQTKFDDDVNKAYKNLLDYQFGGSTIFLGKLQKLLEENKDADLFVLSDMCLNNEKKVHKYLDSEGKDRRVSVFEFFGENSYKYSNVNFYAISSMDDLPKRVFTDLRGKIA